MKKKILALSLVTFSGFALFNAFAQQQPPDTGVGGGGGLQPKGDHACYNTYQTGGTWVVYKCNGCSQVARVANMQDKGSCKQ